MYKDKPDLYGPFWIYTTLIIMIAISGNISRYMEMGVDKFTYNFNYIPIAATIIYSLAVGLPFLLKLMMRFMGQNFFSGTFIEVTIHPSLFHLDNRNLRVFIHIVLNNHDIMRDPDLRSAMGTDRLLSIHLYWFLNGDFLERPQGTSRA